MYKTRYRTELDLRHGHGHQQKCRYIVWGGGGGVRSGDILYIYTIYIPTAVVASARSFREESNYFF